MGLNVWQLFSRITADLLMEQVNLSTIIFQTGAEVGLPGPTFVPLGAGRKMFRE